MAGTMRLRAQCRPFEKRQFARAAFESNAGRRGRFAMQLRQPAVAARQPRSALRVRAASAAPSAPAPPARGEPLKDAATTALLAWAARAGVSHAALAPARFDGGLRGLAATRALSPGDAVASLPHSAVLEVTSSAGAPPPLCDAAVFRSSPWWARLALKLLTERAAGAASRFAPYVASLPQQPLPLPHRWDESWAAWRELPAHVRSRAQAQRASQRAAHAALFPAAAPPPPGYSLPDWEWAVETVRSRTFSGPWEGSSADERRVQLLLVAALLLVYTFSNAGPPENGAAAALSSLLFVFVKDAATSALPNGPRRYVLAPVLDLANHSSGAVSDLAYEYFGDSFSLLTGSSCGAGEEARVSYGPLDGETTLILYGFVESDNAHDVVYFGSGMTGEGAAAARAALSGEELDSLFVSREGVVGPEGTVDKLRAALKGGVTAEALAAAAVRAAYPAAGAAAAAEAAEAAEAAARRGRDRAGDVRSEEERAAAALAKRLHSSKHVTAAVVLQALKAA